MLWAALCEYKVFHIHWKFILKRQKLITMQCMINVHLSCTVCLFTLMRVLMSAPALDGDVEGFVHDRMGMVV